MSLHTNRRVDSLIDLVGNTPLIRLRSVEARAGGGVEIWAKCEFENPGGSVKDRAARQIIRDALAAGHLGGGKRLIDSTSGNTGVAYSMIGAALGVPITLVMPANVSVARKNITSAYGTELIFSSEMEGSDGAIHLARKLADEHPDVYYYPNQYANDSNWRAHYLTTGVEIWTALDGRVTHFCTGIGTTGTVMGTGRRLKEYSAAVQIVAIEPDDEFHGLEGLKHLGSSLVPPIWHPEGVVDRMLPMATDEAWDAADRLNKEEGLFVGHSAGANVAGACRIARDAGPGAVVVTVLPDRGDRYFQPMRWEKQYVW
jgi:S-sulfo-L-cysteine synthase (O-acetyl-L-serine-dependent)